MSLVSIIITTWNNFDSLLHTIKSVLNQTYTNFEIIVVNCNSTDPCYYSKQLESMYNITLIHLPEHSYKNIHCFETKQKIKIIGSSYAKGDWICFLDDSDYWYPEKLQFQLSELSKHPNILFSSTAFHTGNDIYSPSIAVQTSFHTTVPNIIYGKSLGHTNYIHSSTAILHRSILKYMNHWFDLLDHTNCLFISKPLVYVNYLRM